jgi:hypothetical protein
MIISCSGCKQQLRIPDIAQGKLLRCPHCQTTLSVLAAPAPAPAPVTPPIPPPPVVPPPVLDEDEAIQQPRRKRAADSEPVWAGEDSCDEEEPSRPPVDFPSMRFTVRVVKDPKNRLKGQFQAKWSSEGLSLRQPKSDEILIPVGSEAKTLGGGKLSVEVGKRQVQFAIFGMALYHQRLACL